MTESILKLEDVWKSYNIGKIDIPALKEVNIEIRKGEFVAITGPSGSGKSTLMNIIGMLDRPSWGDTYLMDKNVADMDESELAFQRGKTIGFVFQQFNLFPSMNALQNVMLPMEAVDEDEKHAQERAQKLLEMMGLEDRMEHKPNELSGGQQQRVAIARSLANDPEIILADEPTGNLDSKTGEFIVEFLKKLNKYGKTIILITHDSHLVNHTRRIIHIKDGKIIRDSNKVKKK